MPATATEQMILELINRARLDPAAEAARDGIDLNEGLAPGTISATSKQPLAMNESLLTIARAHDQDMLTNNYFAHTDSSGHTPDQRMTAAGYPFTWWGENIAWSGTTGTVTQQMSVDLEEQLFVDAGVNGRGHRVNLLNDNFQEVGDGVLNGSFMGFNATMITQDFGATSTPQLLTGVVFSDTVIADKFYSIGEGRGNVTVAVAGGSSTTTGSAGGYSEAIAAGTQTVTFSGGDETTPAVLTATITAGTNAKIDLMGQSAIRTSVSVTAVSGISTIIGLGTIGLTLTGGAEADTISGGTGNDTLNGGGGFDTADYSDLASTAASLVQVSAGDWTITSADGTDTLLSIEAVKFSDKTVSLGLPSPATVAQFQANKAAYDAMGSFGISDTAANIVGGLSALEADIAHISSITATSGTVTASVTTFLADKAALDKVGTGFSIVSPAAGISAYVYTLEADQTHINAITATSGTVTASVAAFMANETVLNKVAGTFAISDTAANIVGGLTALQADSAHIGSITATSGTVTASVTTFLADEAALNKVATGFSIVSPAAGISAYVYTLEADQTHINAITATSGTVTASVAAFMANETVLNKVAGTFAISDTAANIVGGLSALQADSAHISSITATSGTVTASVTTFLADEAALNKVATGFSIVSPAAGISAYVYTLEADQTHINAITASSGTVTASVAAFMANETVLNKVVGGFAIADTEANAANGLNALENDLSRITSLTFTDPTPPTISLTQAQAAVAAPYLTKIASSYVLNVANSNGSTTTTGHGTAALTINAASTGPDTITGDSGADAFIFKPAFGQDIITNFNATDTITLPASEFGTFATMLRHQSGADTVITNAHNTDTLTLTGITATTLTSAEFKFA